MSKKFFLPLRKTMKKIEFIVDDEFAYLLRSYSWIVTETERGGYSISRKNGYGKDVGKVSLPQQILNKPNTLIRFINGNTLDCRKENLRAFGEVHRVDWKSGICARGHRMTAGNIYLSDKGAKYCIKCDRENGRAYKARKRSVLKAAA